MIIEAHFAFSIIYRKQIGPMKSTWRALEARRKITGRATDWIVVRNRLESVESSNQRQMTQVLDVIQRTLGFRIARGLLERPVYASFSPPVRPCSTR
jgi:hypothetical protein